jgi:hypothetical protein
VSGVNSLPATKDTFIFLIVTDLATEDFTHYNGLSLV